MKKTLRTILAGAVALLAVSCYDDSELKDQNAALQEDLDSFKESLIDASQLGLSRSNFFLRYTDSKTIQLTAENIAEYYVMAKPDGWKASFEGAALTVIAPTKEAYQIGAAELSGEILIHATSNTGACKVAKLAVEAGEGLRLSVDDEGNVNILNAYTSTQSNEEGEDVFGFTNFCIGICPAQEFYSFEDNYKMTFEEAWNKSQSAPTESVCFYYNNRTPGTYVEGEYEIDDIKTTMNTLYNTDMGNYKDLPYGAYVLFAASMNDKGLPADGIVVKDYLNVIHEVEADSLAHDEVVLSLSVAGADSYMIGGVAKNMYSIRFDSFDEYMNCSSMMMMGPWYGFVNYGATMYLGTEIPASEMPAKLSVSQMANYGEPLEPGATYHVWVMPMFNHKKTIDMANSYPDEGYYAYKYNYDYVADFKPFVLEVKANELKAGAVVPTLEEGTKALYEVKGKITLDETSAKVYYAFYTANQWAEFAGSKDAVRNDLFENGSDISSTGEVTYTSNVTPGTEYVLAAVAISKDGKYSDVVECSLSTSDITRDANIAVTLESLNLTDGTYTAVLNVTGATNVGGYNITNSDFDKIVATAEKNILTKPGTATSYQFATVTDGKATVTFTHSNAKADYFVWGYNVVEGEVVLASEPLVFNLAENLPKTE